MNKRSLKKLLLSSFLGTLLVVSFSISAYAESADEALEREADLQRRYQGAADGSGMNYLNPYDSLNNSFASSNADTNFNFAGSATFAGTNNTYTDFNISTEGDLNLGSATVSGLTVNQTIGNSTEMQNLLNYSFNILCQVSALHYMVGSHVSSSDTAYVTVGGQSVAVPLISWTTPNRVTFDAVNGILTNTPGSLIYGTLGYIVQQFALQQADNFYAIGQSILYSFNNLSTDIGLGFSSVLSAIQDQQTYNYWYVVSSQSANGETFTKNVVSSSGTFHSIILNRLEYIADVLTFSFGRFFEWYYPLDVTNPLYWRYWNSDTQQQTNTNLADVLYEMTWYLGNLYILESASAALDGMETAVGNVTTTFETVEAQEQAVINSVQSHINSFNPNVSDFGAFRALPWMSNYLQQIYVSLGTYGLVITIGLFLGVCMQIIGYMRYK